MASGDVAAMPIVDAHQHFWDIAKNYYPWLCDSVPIPFRYGDYSALRRNYLPPDYARDSAGFNIVKTVHMEAEWDRANSRSRDPLARSGQSRIRIAKCLHRSRRARSARHRGRVGRACEELDGARHSA